MDPIYSFGYKLAELTNQKEFAGVGLLCLAIKDSGREFKNLGYNDFKQVFLEYLPKRLDKVSPRNSQLIINEMMKKLNEDQSIFTLSAR